MEFAQGTAFASAQAEALTPEQKMKVDVLAESIRVEDAQGILFYGVSAQRAISDHADSVLAQIRSRDSGGEEDILKNLIRDVQSLDVDGITSIPKCPLSRLFDSLNRKMRRFSARYEALSVDVERTTRGLEAARMRLIKDIALLDGMYERNLENLRALDLYILAGERKQTEIDETVLPALKRQADASGDPAIAQRYEDARQFADRFEKKLHDLRLSRAIALQAGPQLRIIQNSDQALAEKIQSAILNTIPLWKNQIVIALSLSRQKRALETQRQLSHATNAMMRQNATLIKENAADVAGASKRGISELMTLQKTHRDLIATLEEALEIHRDGRAGRMRAEEALSGLEANLKQALLDIRSGDETDR